MLWSAVNESRSLHSLTMIAMGRLLLSEGLVSSTIWCCEWLKGPGSLNYDCDPKSAFLLAALLASQLFGAVNGWVKAPVYINYGRTTSYWRACELNYLMPWMSEGSCFHQLLMIVIQSLFLTGGELLNYFICREGSCVLSTMSVMESLLLNRSIVDFSTT